MAQNVTIAGASYSDVPYVLIPKQGGGMATFIDTSDADAIATDIAVDKTAYVNGQMITGQLEIQNTKTYWVTSNGSVTINPTMPYSAMRQVNLSVNVMPNLQSKTARANGMVTADSGFDGLSVVTVEIPVYDGSVV